jgi:hypothetical protein
VQIQNRVFILPALLGKILSRSYWACQVLVMKHDTETYPELDRLKRNNRLQCWAGFVDAR